MPTPMDAMLGLVLTAIGLLTVVTAFLISDTKKRMISYVLAGVMAVAGLYYYMSSGIRGFQMRRRISNIQRQQQVNLDEIQKRLRETQPKETKTTTPGTPGK